MICFANVFGLAAAFAKQKQQLNIQEYSPQASPTVCVAAYSLTKGGGATPDQSVRAGIGLLYQKGLTTTNGITTWTGGATWNEASQRYNGGGVTNYGNVITMRDAATNPTPQNYVEQ